MPAIAALGVVHNLYKPVTSRFKVHRDSKINGYQSLHTSLFGMHSVPIQLQSAPNRWTLLPITASPGIGCDDGDFDSNQQRARQWTKDLLELQKRAGDPLEFIESLKIDLFPDGYIFTPRGEIMELPTGASAVDFAYNVHTDIGNQCVACRVDGKLAHCHNSSKVASG